MFSDLTVLEDGFQSNKNLPNIPHHKCVISLLVMAAVTIVTNSPPCVAATVKILASDDGHGVVSFNSSQHFLLKEPTSLSSRSQSVATLYVVRNPEDGTFGTVTVQFTITDASGNLADADLRPAQGLVVLEDGVRLKVRGCPGLLALGRCFKRGCSVSHCGFYQPAWNSNSCWNLHSCCFRWWRSGPFLMGNLKGMRPSR